MIIWYEYLTNKNLRQIQSKELLTAKVRHESFGFSLGFNYGFVYIRTQKICWILNFRYHFKVKM